MRDVYLLYISLDWLTLFLEAVTKSNEVCLDCLCVGRGTRQKEKDTLSGGSSSIAYLLVDVINVR